jgi:hypothetical protein
VGPHCPDLLNAFINYWNVFPDSPPPTRLIICLLVRYRKAGPVTPRPAAATGWRNLKRCLSWIRRSAVNSNPAVAAGQDDGSLRAREYLGSLSLGGYGGVRGVVLPEMLPVTLPDAEDFLRDEECFAELCKSHGTSFWNVQRAVEDISSYYDKVSGDGPATRVPMKHLAIELRKVIENNLAERG